MRALFDQAYILMTQCRFSWSDIQKLTRKERMLFLGIHHERVQALNNGNN